MVWLLTGSLALVASQAGAVTFYHWTGGTSTNWLTSGNWLEGVPPIDGTALTIFGDNPTASQHSSLVDVLWSVDGLFLQDDDPYVIDGLGLNVGPGGLSASDPVGKLGASHLITLPIVLSSNQTWINASAGALTLGGIVQLAGHSLTVNTEVGGIATTGSISGTGSLTKSGAGTLTLSGANSYSGTTTIHGGTLKAGADNVIPAETFTLDAGLLDLTGHSEIIGPGAFVLDGLVIGGGPGTLAKVLSPTSPMFISTLGTFVRCVGAVPSEIAGKLELGTNTATRTFDVADNPALDEELVVSADITNAAGIPGPAAVIEKVGPGTMRLSGINTFIRKVRVLEGSLVLTNDHGLGAGGTGNETEVRGPGQLRLTSGMEYVGETLVLGPQGTLRALAGSTRWGEPVSVQSRATVYVEPGELFIEGLVVGEQLSKLGPGILTLETPLPADGFFSLVEGTLRLTSLGGSTSGSGSVAVSQPGTRLEGIGRVPRQISAGPGGTIAPGLSTGALQAAILDMRFGGTLEIEISASDPTDLYDQLQVTGLAQLSGTLHVISPVPLSLGQQFTVLTYGSRTGMFATLDLPALPPVLQWFADYQPNALVLHVQAALDVGPRTPSGTELLAPTPNPAAKGAALRYELSRPGRVTLAVFDAQGRRVASLLDGQEEAAGPHVIDWDRRDEAGGLLPAGNYIVRLSVDGRAVGAGRKLSLVR